MNDFVAYISRVRIAAMVLGCAVFVGLGAWFAGLVDALPAPDRYGALWMATVGWASMVFFGLCGVVCILSLFESRERVRIGPNGVRTAQWSNDTIPWSEIVQVSVWSNSGQDAIILHLRDRSRFPPRGVAALLAGANREFTGGDVGISLTATNRTFEEAMEAIRVFRPASDST